ncbi:hypothetical protein [Micromonospora tulbaghiae]|uniref:hypothetical protein n=1 Tax=Micromonospora TaxID=1873 RepID=UPI0013BA77F3|nr:hypothetical protein [Micromonospora tulbaghiae]NED56470.1 hypothetical protein [Micromonospora aurantiaca]
MTIIDKIAWMRLDNGAILSSGARRPAADPAALRAVASTGERRSCPASRPPPT